MGRPVVGIQCADACGLRSPMPHGHVYKSAHSHYCTLRVCRGPQQTRTFSPVSDLAEILTLVDEAVEIIYSRGQSARHLRD